MCSISCSFVFFTLFCEILHFSCAAWTNLTDPLKYPGLLPLSHNDNVAIYDDDDFTSDISVSDETEDDTIGPDSTLGTQSAAKTGSLWPMGIVYFMIDFDIFDSLTKNEIFLAVDRISKATCIRFVFASSEDMAQGNYLYFTNPHGVRECVHHRSLNTTSTGLSRITVVLGFDCLSHRDVLHSIMHGLGLKDEITHPQRDQYVHVLWENIHPKDRHLFQLDLNYINATGVLEYDPQSLMHFHDRAYSVNGKATIAPQMSGLRIAPSDFLSQIDQMKLRLLFNYECNKREVSNLLNTCKDAFYKPKDSDNNDKNKLYDGAVMDADYDYDCGDALQNPELPAQHEHPEIPERTEYPEIPEQGQNINSTDEVVPPSSDSDCEDDSEYDYDETDYESEEYYSDDEECDSDDTDQGNKVPDEGNNKQARTRVVEHQEDPQPHRQ